MPKTKVEIRTSPIAGKGVFAFAPIGKGEVVLVWAPLRRLKASDIDKFDEAERHYIGKGKGDECLLMGEPERYVNHSCEPNTEVREEADVALRDISPGEEITSDYGREGSTRGFPCRCGAPSCRGWIGRSESAP